MSVSRANMPMYFEGLATLLSKAFSADCLTKEKFNLTHLEAVDILNNVKCGVIDNMLTTVDMFETNTSETAKLVKAKSPPKKKPSKATTKDNSEAISAKADKVASLQKELATLTGKTDLQIAETSIVKLRKQIQAAKVEINRAKRAADKEKKEAAKAKARAEKEVARAKAKAEKDAAKAKAKAEKEAARAAKAEAKQKEFNLRAHELIKLGGWVEDKDTLSTINKKIASLKKKAEKANKPKKEAVPKVSKKAQKIAALKKELATLKGVSVDSLTVEDKVLKIRAEIEKAKKANELANIKAKRADKPKKEAAPKKAAAPKPDKRLAAKKKFIMENIPAEYRSLFATDEQIKAAKTPQLRAYAKNIELYNKCIELGLRNVNGSDIKPPHEASPKYYKSAIKAACKAN